MNAKKVASIGMAALLYAQGLLAAVAVAAFLAKPTALDTAGGYGVSNEQPQQVALLDR